MKCPTCGNRNKIDIYDGDGFAQDIRQCSNCGCAWTWSGDNRVIMTYGNPKDTSELKVVYLENYKGDKLSYKHDGDSGFDLRAGIDESVLVFSGDIRIIPTGIKVATPKGTELQVRPRSGTALKGLTVINTPGTVDSCYRGEVGVIVVNLAKEPFTISPGDRIAQGVICPVFRANFVEVEDLSDTTRGAGAYNSTGVR